MEHRSLVIRVLALTGLLIVADGWWFSVVQQITFWHGIYCIWMTAITVGGDITPVRQGYICLAIAPVPLLAAAFSLLTSGLTSIHVKHSTRQIMKHVTDTVSSPTDVSPGKIILGP